MNPIARLLAAAASALVTTHAVADSQWLHYAGNPGGQQYSALDQIDANNVTNLQIAWQYRTGELSRRTPFQNATAKVQVNPILLPEAAGGSLVICTPFNRDHRVGPGARHRTLELRSRHPDWRLCDQR